MRIMVIYEECNNAELLEKMKQVKSYEEFEELRDFGYDTNELADAFAAVNGEYMSEESIYDDLYSAYYNGLDDEIIDTLEYKAHREKEQPREPKEGTALAILLDKIRSQKQARSKPQSNLWAK